jgi:Helix-turn-helix domain
MSSKSELPLSFVQEIVKRTNSASARRDYVLIRADQPIPEVLEHGKTYVLSTGAVANMLHVSTRQVQLLCNKGEIRYTRLSSPHRRFLLEDVLEYLKTQKALSRQFDELNGNLNVLVLGSIYEDMPYLLKTATDPLNVSREVYIPKGAASGIVKLAQVPMEVTVVDTRGARSDWVSILHEIKGDPKIVRNLGKLYIVTDAVTTNQSKLASDIVRLGGEADVLLNVGQDAHAISNILQVHFRGQYAK